ncbi:hypothetical protein Q9966_016408, partial [Columba livia]
MERRGPGLAALGALGRRLLWALPAYAAGLLGLGAGALLLALALYAGWRRRRRDRERGLRLAARLQSDEEAAVRAAAAGLGAARGELPAWVSFPDVERAEWLNKVLAQAWPFFGQYMEKLLVDKVAPSIRASNTHLQTFTFTKVDMGEKPLRVLGVRAHPGAHKQQILLDLNISYVGDVQIDVEVKKFFCKAGVKGMQLHGMLRIILEPLLGDVPIVGAVTMFFIRRPVNLGHQLDGMTNLLDIPGLSSMSDTMIMDTIASYLVLPNRLLVPLVPDLPDAAQLRCPPAPGGWCGCISGAPGTCGPRTGSWGGWWGGKSDPYAVLRVGTQVVTSRVIDDNLNPTWDEVYEFIVHEVPGQELEVELLDKDPDQDDLLGRMKVDLGEVLKARVLEEVKKPGKEPNPVVQVSVQDVTRESKVKDDPRQSPLGSLSLPLARLLDAPDLALSQPFQLQHSGPRSRLHLKLVLRHVLRIHLLEAENLVAKDNLFGGAVRGRSDPYAKVRVAGGVFRSRVIKENLNPRWNEIYEDVEFDLFDKDIDKDDFLGRCKVPLRRVLSSRIVDELRKGSKPPAALATLTVRDVSVKTKTCAPNSEPVWDEGFSFLIKRPHVESLELQVLVSQQVELGGGQRRPGRGGTLPPQPMEAPGDEESGAGGLRQRLLPPDSHPEPPEGPLGRLQLTLWYHRDERKLVAIVHCCRKLRGVSKELPDPYVSLVLLPDRGRSTKRKTGVQKKTLNPDFNERFEWDVSLDEVSRRKLEAQVKSTVSFVSREKEVLGKLHLDLAQVDLSEGGTH